MSNAFVALIVIALMLMAVLSWSQVSFGWVDSSIQSWKETMKTAQEVSRTDIAVTGANVTAPYVEVLTRNSGKVHLAQFGDWDVLVQYYDGSSAYHIGSLAYTTDAAPSSDEWTVATIYTDDTRTQEEVFEPGVLNPGELMLMRLRLNPQPGGNTTNLVAISSPNGVATSAQFQG